MYVFKCVCSNIGLGPCQVFEVASPYPNQGQDWKENYWADIFLITYSSPAPRIKQVVMDLLKENMDTYAMYK